jgi:3-hydroxyisobutyrate dehydrogenase-like beta-hydroxyacid dehydrogenase
MNITIIGTGKMACGITSRSMEGGHNVTLVGHTLVRLKPWLKTSPQE